MHIIITRRCITQKVPFTIKTRILGNSLVYHVYIFLNIDVKHYRKHHFKSSSKEKRKPQLLPQILITILPRINLTSLWVHVVQTESIHINVSSTHHKQFAFTGYYSRNEITHSTSSDYGFHLITQKKRDWGMHIL